MKEARKKNVKHTVKKPFHNWLISGCFRVSIIVGSTKLPSCFVTKHFRTKQLVVIAIAITTMWRLGMCAQCESKLPVSDRANADCMWSSCQQKSMLAGLPGG